MRYGKECLLTNTCNVEVLVLQFVSIMTRGTFYLISFLVLIQCRHGNRLTRSRGTTVYRLFGASEFIRVAPLTVARQSSIGLGGFSVGEA